MIAEVLKNIEQHNDFVLTSHARPDGDAVGSILACYQILKSLGKNADAVLSDGVPMLYRPLPFADRVVKTSRVNGNYQAAIILECDSLQRTRVQGLERHFLINIDHHVSGRPFAHVNWIDPTACATAEMIYQLACASGVKITPEIATCLYTAVFTDTGSFCFAGTSERTFALAQELVRAGANPSRIAQSVYFSSPVSKMRLLGAALTSLQREGRLAWMWVSRQDMERCQAVEEDCEGLVNYALSIAGVEVAAFFRELPEGRYRVSLRSKGAVNVSVIAARFNGGGHECASGCSVEGPLHRATEIVLGELRAALAGIG
jgi:bifunctional oligoribonuclease and PAP phosphatase NrnA